MGNLPLAYLKKVLEAHFSFKIRKKFWKTFQKIKVLIKSFLKKLKF